MTWGQLICAFLAGAFFASSIFGSIFKYPIVGLVSAALFAAFWLGIVIQNLGRS